MKTGSRQPPKRRRSEIRQTLDVTEAKFATVFRVCPDIITITDAATGRYIDVNQAFERVLGYDKAEVIGRTSVELGIWESPEERARILAALTEAPRLENFEIRVRRKNGEVFDGLLSVERTRLGGEDRLIMVARDISDRKRGETLLRQTAEELQRSNMDLERFAYVAAHDLQEPCRTICSFAQMLEKRHGAQLDHEGREWLGYLTGGALRMRDLIQGLLVYSRVGIAASRFVPVDLGPVVNGIVADLASALTACGGTVEIGPLPTLRADPAQLRQLFLNLIGNGLKFQADGTRPRIGVSAERLEAGWRIAVTDNGIGIDPAYAEDIFVAFRRLHGPDRYPGAGIGLAVVKRIVDTHRGRIEVDSTPGRGSTFRVTLPD